MMIRTISLLTLGFFSSLMMVAITESAIGQEKERPAMLSMDGIAELAEPLDMSIFNLPEDAKTAAALLDFIDELPNKVAEPKSQVEMMQMMEGMTRAYTEAANKVLALSDATAEEREKATQLKIVALTAKSRMDPKAVDELALFVDSLVADAKEEQAKIKAYQLKLQVLVSSAPNDPTVLDKVSVLADEILALDGAELQVLGMEIKAQALLSKGQKSPEAYDELIIFAEGVLKVNQSERLVEKARELKFLALMIGAQQDENKIKAFDNYFNELSETKMSETAKSNIYKLRIQPLMDPKNTDPQAQIKLLEVVSKLEKEDSEELQKMAVALKSSTLLKVAEADPSRVDDLFKYADEILKDSKSDERKTQAIGMKIQAYLLKAQDDLKVYDELLTFIDKVIADKPGEELLHQLVDMKIQLQVCQVAEDPTKIEATEKMIQEYAEMSGLEQTIANSRAVLSMFKVEKFAKSNAKIDELNAVLVEVKKFIEADPSMISLLMEMKDSINTIGKNNNEPGLYAKVLAEFIAFCKDSDNAELKNFVEPLESLMKLANLTGTPFAFEGVVAGPEADKKFATSSLKGKVFLVDLWSTANPAYFETVDSLKALYDGFKEKGFEIVGVNFDQNPQMVTRTVEVFGISWPVVSDKLTKDAGMTLPEFISPSADGSKILVGTDGKVIMVTNELDDIAAKLIELFGEPVLTPVMEAEKSDTK